MKDPVPSTSGVSPGWLLITIAVLAGALLALGAGVALLFGALELIGRH